MKYISFKKTFDQSLIESIVTKDKKKSRLLIECLKNEKPLNELYYLISSITLPDIEDETHVATYIDQLKIASKDLKDKLTLYESFFNSFSQPLELTPLEQNIETLLFTKNSPYNVKEKTQAYHFIFEHIKSTINTNKQELTTEAKLKEYSLLVESLNEEYKEILRTFLLSEEKSIEFNKVKEKTVDYLIERYEKGENADKVKDAILKINKIKYHPDTYVGDIIQFLKLISND